MEALPVELISCILEHLDDIRDLKSCCLVSRGFLQCSVRHLWRDIQVDGRPLSRNLLLLASQIGSTSYRGGEVSEEDDVLRDIRSGAVPLKRKLSWVVSNQDLAHGSSDTSPKRSCSISSDGYQSVVDFMPPVEGGDVIIQSADQMFDYRHFVRSFAIVSTYPYPESVHGNDLNNLQEILRNVYMLRFLCVEKIASVDDETISAIVHAASSFLERVHLKSCPGISDFAIRNITINASRLFELSISGCTQLTDESLFWVSAHARGLKHLNLTDCGGITSTGIIYLCSGLSQLRVLILARCYRMKGSDIASLCACNSQLGCLDLESVRSIDDQSLNRITMTCRCLTTLSLEKCRGITDSGLSGITNCQKLQVINLTHCYRLTGDTLARLYQPCMHHLSELFLGRCSGFTKQAIINLARNMSHLKRIYLAGNDYVDDRCVIEILKNCNQLEVLSVPGCPITDITVYAAVDLVSQTLLVGQFSFCDNVSPDAVGRMAYHCQKLSILQLMNCRQILDSYVMGFSNPCPEHLIARYEGVYCAIRPPQIEDLGKAWFQLHN